MSGDSLQKMMKRRNDAMYADAGIPNNNKIIASKMGPHGTFLDSAQNHYKELATGENPELGKKIWNENQQIFYLQFLDSIVRGEIRLEDEVRMWLKDDATWVSKLFPETKSESTQVMMHRIVINRELVRIGVYNTPARVVGSTTESITFNTSFRQQAFESDYYALKQAGGMEIFNRMMAQLYSNLKASETYATISTLSDFVSQYSRPEQRYPFESRPPADPYAVMRLEQKNLASLNKEGLGLEMLSTKANEILSREFEKLVAWIVSPDDLDFLHSSDNAKNVFTFISGDQALANRSKTKEPMRSEIAFHVIPMLAENIHNGSSEYLNTHIISNGSLAIFLNDHTESPAEKYLSSMTDVYMISAPTDAYDRYRFIDCLTKDFRFQAIDRCSSLLYPDRSTRYTGFPTGSQASLSRMDYISRNAALPGHINRNLINHFLENPRGIFERHRTAATPENHATLDVLVRYDPTIMNNEITRETTGGNTLYPLTFMGEVAEQRARLPHMRFCYKTLAHRIFHGIDNEAYGVFQRGLTWASRMSKGFAKIGEAFKDAQIADLAANAPAVVYTADTRAARKELRRNAEIIAERATMLKPNKWGGMLSEMNAGATAQVPYGYGNISGMYTILDAIQRGFGNKFDAETQELVPKFIPIYERVVNNMMNCLPEHICLSPSMVPYIHDSDEMSDIMRVRIVAWYTVFSNFVPPSYFFTGSGTTSTRAPRNPVVKNSKYLGGLTTIGDLMKAAAALDPMNASKDDLTRMYYISDLASKLCTFPATDNITGVGGAIAAYNDNTTFIGSERGICATQLCFVSESVNSSKLFYNATETGEVTLEPAELHTIVDDKDIDLIRGKYRHEMKNNTFTSSTSKTTLHPDRISFSDSLFAVAPYINPVFPLIGRTTELLNPLTFKLYRETVYPAWMKETRPKAFDLRNHLFHNNYPLTGDSYTYSAIDYALEYTAHLYNEKAYKLFRQTHPSVHEGLAHLFFFPVNGNFNERAPGRIEDFDRRWNLTYSYELRESIAGRLMCLRDITVQALTAAYDNNICTPLSGTIIRRMETQRFKSFIGVSEGAIGMSVKGNYDQLQMFHAGVKTFRTEASINHGAAVTEKEKVVVMEFCRGLEHLGGKGNGWVRDKVNVPAIMDDLRDPSINIMNRNMLNGATLGNDSNIFVLQGISSNIGTNGGKQTIDVCGYWDQRDFVGRLHDCPEFEDKNQKEWMYDGVAFTNFIYDFIKHRESSELLPINKYSLRNIAQTRLLNFHCNMTSMRMHDRSHGIHTVTSRHALGEQREGSIAIETSRGRIGYVTY